MTDYLRARPLLVEAFRAGKREALDEIYWAYVEHVERFARRGFAVGDGGARLAASGADLEDLVQETFLRAFSERAREQYDPTRDFGAWIHRIARNALVDRARRAGRELGMSAAELDAVADDGAAGSDTDDWAAPNVQAIVDRYLSGLPDDLAKVHEARFVLGLPQREAAERLGISRQTLRTREGHLRDGLRRALAGADLEK